MNHLYRKSFPCAIALWSGIFLWFSPSAGYAQRPELRRPQDQQAAQPAPTPPKPAKRVRAIGVVEFLPAGGTRLVPVALWIDGKYQDASLYKANPLPFALEPGTVYEGQNYGETAGTFVINMPKQSNAGWIGDGRWTPYRPVDAQIAAAAAKQPKPKSKDGKAIFTSGSDDGPPVLRRPETEQGSPSGQSPAAAQASAPSKPAPAPESQPQPSATPTTSDSAPGRPTLHRPNDQADSAPATAPQQASTASVDDSDPERPVLRKPSAPPSSAPATAAATTPGGAAVEAGDPDRPVLTRGSSQSPAAKPVQQKAPVTSVTATGTASKSGVARSMVAISDAGKYENRPLIYSTTPERQQQLAQPMLDLAIAEVRAFTKKYTSSPQLPKNVAITDYDLRFFDLDFSNSPTLVLTAKLPMGMTGSRPFFYYATVVARLDINGDPVKAFSSVTDTRHLDVFPRLELIDALDANGNGRGDLLFRQYSDTGLNYGLYRVFPYNMEKVFEGGSSL